MEAWDPEAGEGGRPGWLDRTDQAHRQRQRHLSSVPWRAGAYVVYTGTYTLSLGLSSADLPFSWALPPVVAYNWTRPGFPGAPPAAR